MITVQNKQVFSQFDTQKHIQKLTSKETSSNTPLTKTKVNYGMLTRQLNKTSAALNSPQKLSQISDEVLIDLVVFHTDIGKHTINKFLLTPDIKVGEDKVIVEKQPYSACYISKETSYTFDSPYALMFANLLALSDIPFSCDVLVAIGNKSYLADMVLHTPDGDIYIDLGDNVSPSDTQHTPLLCIDSRRILKQNLFKSLWPKINIFSLDTHKPLKVFYEYLIAWLGDIKPNLPIPSLAQCMAYSSPSLNYLLDEPIEVVALRLCDECRLHLNSCHKANINSVLTFLLQREDYADIMSLADYMAGKIRREKMSSTKLLSFAEHNRYLSQFDFARVISSGYARSFIQLFQMWRYEYDEHHAVFERFDIPMPPNEISFTPMTDFQHDGFLWELYSQATLLQ